MAQVSVANLGRTAVLVDSKGHTLGPKERMLADDSDRVTAHAIATKQLRASAVYQAPEGQN